MNPKPIIGLIGAIGAGKSTVASQLAKRGAYIIDADQLGHQALNQSTVLKELQARWGNQILQANGQADRRMIATIVFPKPEERIALERIVFPVIADLAQEEIRRAEQNSEYRLIVLDAAVLLEAGWKDYCDKIVYIDAPQSLREQRVLQRSGWTADELRQREQSQWPAKKKMSLSDAVIENASTPERLQESVDQVLQEWGWLPTQG